MQTLWAGYAQGHFIQVVRGAISFSISTKVHNTEGPRLTRILGLEKNRIMQNLR